MKDSGQHSKETPDLKLALESLQMCRRPNGTFLVDQYLCACNQLLGYVSQLSKGLKVTLRRMKTGIKALEIRRVAGPRNFYETFQTIIEYELSTGQARSKSPLSGCKALLLVHEHFKFITKLLQMLVGAEQCERGESLIDSYQRTVASYHSNPMRALCKVCLMAAPSRGQLLTKVARNQSEASHILGELLKAADPICDRIHQLCFDTNLEKTVQL